MKCLFKFTIFNVFLTYPLQAFRNKTFTYLFNRKMVSRAKFSLQSSESLLSSLVFVNKFHIRSYLSTV